MGLDRDVNWREPVQARCKSLEVGEELRVSFDLRELRGLTGAGRKNQISSFRVSDGGVYSKR